MNKINRREVFKRTASLMGYTLSAAALTSLVACTEKAEQAQQAQQAQQAKGEPNVSLSGKSYKLLTTEQANTLYVLSDLVLPAGVTVGANDVAVVSFIDIFVADVFNENDRSQFTSGLDIFNAKVQKVHQKVLSVLSIADQTALLSVLEDETYDWPQDKKTHEHYFYRRFKEILLNAYFQSKKVGTEVLAYDPVPGEQIGCMDYDGKSWSLR